MNIERGAGQFQGSEPRGDYMYIIIITGGVLLYASMFVAVFEHHRLQALCVTFCLALSLRFFLREYDLRLERRVLESIKQESPSSR
jgi:hypothetical protein